MLMCESTHSNRIKGQRYLKLTSCRHKEMHKYFWQEQLHLTSKVIAIDLLIEGDYEVANYPQTQRSW